jgi:hypothetical protein
MNINKAVLGARLAGAVILILGSASCGDMAREGQGSSYLIISTLTASSGAEPGTFGGELRSDVVTVVDEVPSIFNDNGQVEFLLRMKNPVLAPSSANAITIDRYRVTFTRADGRNTPGVDVPYGFDGAITGTVVTSASLGFTLVRHQAKLEAPLSALASNGVLVSTIAEITFYGRDQTGKAVSVTGRITVHFGNFGDPA